VRFVDSVTQVHQPLENGRKNYKAFIKITFV